MPPVWFCLRRLAPWALVLLLASGCRLKSPPALAELVPQALPTTTISDAWVAAPADTALPLDGWIASFGDSVLAELVHEGILANTDLRASLARVEQAAASVRIAGGKMYPAVDAVAHGGLGLGGDGSGLNAALLQAAWEMDFWGKIRYGRAAVTETYGSRILAHTFARRSLAAAIAKSWFLLTEGSLQVRLAREAATAADSVLNLVLVRQRVGQSNEQEVAVARADLFTYRDAIVRLEQANAEAARALEVLLGRYPAGRLAGGVSLDSTPAGVPSGLPSALLERRPDILASERQVAAAFYRTKEADAARLPSISLTASFGVISSDFLQLQEDFSNPILGLGLNLFAPLFRGGALKAQVELRTAEQKEAMANYGGVVLRAFSEVENALGAETRLREREGLLQQVVTENARGVELGRVQYRVGTGNLLSVQQQQLRLYSAQTALLRVQSERLIQRVNLHLALGGDFIPGPPPADSTSAAPR